MFKVTWLNDAETVTQTPTGTVTKAERRVSSTQCYLLVDALVIHNALAGYYQASHAKVWDKDGRLIRSSTDRRSENCAAQDAKWPV